MSINQHSLEFVRREAVVSSSKKPVDRIDSAEEDRLCAKGISFVPNEEPKEDVDWIDEPVDWIDTHQKKRTSIGSTRPN